MKYWRINAENWNVQMFIVVVIGKQIKENCVARRKKDQHEKLIHFDSCYFNSFIGLSFAIIIIIIILELSLWFIKVYQKKVFKRILIDQYFSCIYTKRKNELSKWTLLAFFLSNFDRHFQMSNVISNKNLFWILHWELNTNITTKLSRVNDNQTKKKTRTTKIKAKQPFQNETLKNIELAAVDESNDKFFFVVYSTK